MRLDLILMSISLLFSVSAFGEGQTQQKILNRLEKRKAAYDKYQEESKKRDKNRMSDADDQKVLRKKYENQKVKARENFVRVETGMPLKAYLKFVAEREKERAEMEKARRNEVLFQKSLREAYEKSRYKINKMEEYKL